MKLKITEELKNKLRERINMGHGCRAADMCMLLAQSLSKNVNAEKADKMYAELLEFPGKHLKEHGSFNSRDPKIRLIFEKETAAKYAKFEAFRRATIAEWDVLKAAWDEPLQEWLEAEYGPPTRDQMGVIVAYGKQPSGLILTARFKMMRMSACSESPYHAYSTGGSR